VVGRYSKKCKNKSIDMGVSPKNAKTGVSPKNAKTKKNLFEK